MWAFGHKADLARQLADIAAEGEADREVLAA